MREIPRGQTRVVDKARRCLTDAMLYQKKIVPRIATAQAAACDGGARLAGAESRAVVRRGTRLDPFIARVLSLLDSGHLRAVVLLLRIDHTEAGGRAAVLNRAAREWTCCWRPRWVPGTKGNGRW